ncbi:MAG: nucleotidyltransferase family protein [Candidatus Geothermarchaeales archaeon]
MNWEPSWLGKSYCEIFLVFGSREFGIDDLKEGIGWEDAKIRTVLSRLRKAGYLRRRGRGRYEALDPYQLILSIANPEWESKIKQREYIPLISKVLSCLLKRYENRLISALLFGSVARGEAEKTSDLDLLIVVEGLPEKFTERVAEVVEALEPAREEKRRLWEESKIYVSIRPIPLHPTEAAIHQPLYLDLIHDAIVLLDRGFMSKILEKIKLRLRELGSQKITLPDGRWYWRLKPGIRPGEVVEI